MLKQRIQESNETKDECRTRVLRTCQAAWRSGGDQGVALRREWQLKAVAANSIVQPTSDASGHGIIIAQEQEPPKVRHMDNLSVFGGSGSMGVGDHMFGIAPSTIETADSVNGFVKTSASAWQSRVAGENTDIPFQLDPAGTTRLSCLETYGFCKNDIVNLDQYNTLVDHILKYVAQYRQRHLVSGRNKGPNSSLQIPLLFAFNTKLD